MNDLLICAKAVGHDAIVEEYPSPYDESMIQVVRIKIDDPQGAFQKAFPYCIDYDPRTNDAQAFELLKHLIRTIPDHRTLWLTLINLTRNGELSNEAIIKAVVAMEDTHE